MAKFLPLLIFFTGLLLLNCGCRKNDDIPIFDIDIEDEFYIDLWEGLKPSSRSLHLNVQTIEKKPCQNASLTFSHDTRGNTYSISINQLTEPMDCIEDSSYIQALIPISEFQVGTYNLHVNLKEEIINKGKLHVTIDHYQLDLETNFGISLTHPRLYRVAPQSIWGHVAYQEMADKEIADNFMEDLFGITKSINANVGYYGYFTIESNSVLPKLNYSIDHTDHQSFYLLYENELSDLISLIEQYRTQYPGRVEINIFTSGGYSL